MSNEEICEFYKSDAQSAFDAAGFKDVTAGAGYLKHGNELRLEIRLNGVGALEARKHLPFSDNA
jgi:hypothetical protein